MSATLIHKTKFLFPARNIWQTDAHSQRQKPNCSTVAGNHPNCAFLGLRQGAKKALVVLPTIVHRNPTKTHEFAGVYFHLKI